MVRKITSLERLRSSDAFTALVVCAAIFSDSFIYDVIIPFIPQMLERRLHLPRTSIQAWTSTLLGVFGGCFAVGNVLAGYLTDHSPSTTFPFLLGMVTLVASSLMFFLGQHVGVTIAARALQGLSASFVWVSGLAYLNSKIKPAYIGTAMGYVSVAMAAGELLGPLVGGAMYEHAGHYAVLGLVCGILGVDIILRLMLVDWSSMRNKKHDEDQDDERRALLNDESNHEANGTTEGVPSTQDKVETRHINILGLRLDRDLCASFYAACIIGTIRYSFESALSVFVSQRFSWSTSASGGILFAFLSPAVLGPLVGKYVTKHGPRWFSVVAFVIAATALVGLGLLTHPDTTTKVFYVVVVAVIGICVCSLVTVQTIAFSVAAKRRELEAKQSMKKGSTGSTFGGFSMAWTVGMFVGPLAAEVFIDHVSWLAFCIFLASLCVVSAVVSTFTWTEWQIPEEDK